MDSAALEKLEAELSARRHGIKRPIHFPGVDLSGAPLPGAELGGAYLKGATFTRASLVGANFGGANLEGAVLHAADLGAADFTDAKMVGVDLSKCQWDDAILTNADLRGAYLRDTRGEPLSMAGARIDKKAITRSGLVDADVNRLIALGVVVEEPESVPPVARELISLHPPSFVTILHVQESESRSRSISLAPQAPRSSRKMASFLTRLVEDARVDQGLPHSLRSHALPSISVGALLEATNPEVGSVFLGVKLEKELSGASVARTFLGLNQDGQQVFVKAFDPLRHGAALHLPAFQRGLRAMNRAMIAGDPALHTMDLLAVAPDLTAYVARYYGDGTLEQLVSVEISLDTGLHLFEQLCASFSAVHRQGGLVRSIKPANILLEGLTPVLSEIDMIDLPTMKECSGNAGGYAAYAAPEELCRTGTRSPTADVFALGKLLEYLLTGNDPVDPLSGQSTLKERTGIPKFLVELVESCTFVDPADRFQLVQPILDEVARFRAEGKSAQLKAPMRVVSLSRVESIPSLLPAEREAIFGEPMIIPDEDWQQDEEPQPWLARGLEIGISGAALMALVLMSLVLWTSPSSVDFVERAWIGICAVVGFAVWLIPPPARKLRAFRLATWAAAVAGLFVIGPMPLVRLRWMHDLEGSHVAKKERAIENLIRSGARNLSHKNLARLSLVSQDLSSVQFRGASLRGAQLSHSLIRESNFDSADLEAAEVYGADLRLSKLDAAKGLSSLKCDDATLFPEGLRCVDGLTQQGDLR